MININGESIFYFAFCVLSILPGFFSTFEHIENETLIFNDFEHLPFGLFKFLEIFDWG